MENDPYMDGFDSYMSLRPNPHPRESQEWRLWEDGLQMALRMSRGDDEGFTDHSLYLEQF